MKLNQELTQPNEVKLTVPIQASKGSVIKRNNSYLSPPPLILKLGISALPITMNTKPIKVQKNDDANKLAETTCCIPSS